MTVADLRREFATLAGTYAPSSERRDETATVADGEASPSRSVDSHHVDDLDERRDEPDVRVLASDDDSDGDDEDWERILVEELKGLREEEDRIERQAEEELRIVLEALGPTNLDRRMTVEDADPDEAKRQAGSRQAAAASRIAMNGARSTNWTHMTRDRRALGYVRLSRTGTPRGWCAMLISRGPVHKSRESATFADGDRYHDNCHCYAMPIWNRDQYQSSELTAISRQYEALGPEVTKGHTGKGAVSVWRRYIRKQQRVAAQEARQSTSTAPEA
ncbi:hypothetical protein [Streptomyces sp. NPDC088254]|uniref:VG15 protein n=1 Tax=Streptomyces sp. NPDC088254 TaxID=3365847 RepID=UPI0038002538